MRKFDRTDYAMLMAMLALLLVALALMLPTGCTLALPGSAPPPDAVPAECVDIPVDAPPLPRIKELAAVQDDPRTIDIMYALSPQTVKAKGTLDKAASYCADLTAFNNVRLADSQCAPRLRLVKVFAWARNQSGNTQTDLSALASDPAVAAARDACGADLVQGIVESASNAAGTAYRMSYNNTAFASSAFSIVVRAYAAGANYSSLHEFLHNFGCGHDKSNSSGVSITGFAFGYRGKNYRDVMSYAPGTRLGYLSNGNRFLVKAPTGSLVALGDTLADNARVVQITSSTVANFRRHTIPL